MTQAYPLHWPTSQPRTPSYRRKANAHFSRNLSVMGALRDVQNEVRLLGGLDLVVSSNIKLRVDGLPRSPRGNLSGDVGYPKPPKRGALIGLLLVLTTAATALVIGQAVLS